MNLGGKIRSKKGKLLVIDGISGSGKETQIELLSVALKQSGYEVERIDFPDPGSIHPKAREQRTDSPFNPYAACIFFALDRYNASSQINEWIRAGKVVIANRYVTASAAYQGIKLADTRERVKFFKWLNNLEYEIFETPRPDLNLVLHVPARLAKKLAQKKQKDAKKDGAKAQRPSHDQELLSAAEKIFVEIARMFPNTKLVECAVGDKLLTPQQVQNKIWNLVRRIAFKNEM